MKKLTKKQIRENASNDACKALAERVVSYLSECFPDDNAKVVGRLVAFCSYPGGRDSIALGPMRVWATIEGIGHYDQSGLPVDAINLHVGIFDGQLNQAACDIAELAIDCAALSVRQSSSRKFGGCFLIGGLGYNKGAHLLEFVQRSLATGIALIDGVAAKTFVKLQELGLWSLNDFNGGPENAQITTALELVELEAVAVERTTKTNAKRI